MSNLTSGFLNVTMMQFETVASLQAIAAAMAIKPANHAVLAPGWGSINDDESSIGEFRASPASPGKPTIEPPLGPYGERLYARQYYWTPDRDAIRVIGTSASPQDVSKLRATDFVLTRMSQTSIMVAVTSRNSKDLSATLAPTLQATVVGVDPKARILRDTSPLDLVTSDLFMWLLHRYDSKQQMTNSIKLTRVREITSRDTLKRGANLTRGVDLSRRELLALITNVSIDFGPAKIVTYDANSDGQIDFELFVDGGFSVNTGETRYGTTLIPRGLIGIQAVSDLIFVIVPKLRETYLNDKNWKNGGQLAFVNKCLAKLQRIPTHATTLANPCTHCGGTGTV